ncbi:MAG TPA: mismatch-specific DNA-glycosylase [Acidimicrobiia bacterium]
MGYTRAELEACRGKGVPDLVGPDMRLLFVGINPGLWTAAAQAHFAKPGNRFYPALFAAGLSSRLIAPSAGLDPVDESDLVRRGIGVSNLVNKATVRADELSTAQLRGGAANLQKKVARWKPEVVVMLGVTAYRVAFDRPRARQGWQAETLGGSELMVAGNPSGLNAHETVASLAETFREAAARAGIVTTTAPA